MLTKDSRTSYDVTLSRRKRFCGKCGRQANGTFAFSKQPNQLRAKIGVACEPKYFHRGFQCKGIVVLGRWVEISIDFLEKMILELEAELSEIVTGFGFTE